MELVDDKNYCAVAVAVVEVVHSYTVVDGVGRLEPFVGETRVY